MFGRLKAAYREQVNQLERGGVDTISKEHFTSLYTAMRGPKLLLRGTSRPGLVPFHFGKVLKSMPMLPAALTIATSDPVTLCPQEPVLPTPVTALAPTTPRPSEAPVSLQNQIVKRYAYALDKASKRRLHEHLGKFVNAAQICLVKGSLQQDRMRFLMQINDEAKTRRSTKSDIVAKGEGLVISYEHLVAKRAARAAYEQFKALVKGKRGWKRKRQAEGDIDEPLTKNTWKSEAQPGEAALWRAPVVLPGESEANF